MQALMDNLVSRRQEKIPLESEYEYRMTAVAYSEEQGEKRLFELNDSYFNHAEITLLDKDEYKTPELFFW